MLIKEQVNRAGQLRSARPNFQDSIPSLSKMKILRVITQVPKDNLLHHKKYGAFGYFDLIRDLDLFNCITTRPEDRQPSSESVIIADWMRH